MSCVGSLAEPVVAPGRDYRALRDQFRWNVPERMNLAWDVCHRWAADPGRLALLHLHSDGRVDRWSFRDIRDHANRLANALGGLGVGPGDRVAIVLPQLPQTAISHVAVYAMGAIAVPMTPLFGPEALEHRLRDSGTAVLITDRAGVERVTPLRAALPDLREIVSTDGPVEAALGFDDLIARASPLFEPLMVGADQPALISYTSGTTGQPKGALHAHRVVLGHMPGVELPQDFFPQPGDRFWTPADWAWFGGLMDVLLPSWYHGVPVVAYRSPRFDPEDAFRVMATLQVRNMFLPPTALKLLRQVPVKLSRARLQVRSIASGGEPLGGELVEWGRETFGVTINEFYGQTECNVVVGNCGSLFEPRPGSMGRPIPGHEVAVLDDNGRPCAPGESGTIAIRRPDPVMFLSYWNQPDATAGKFMGDWMLTGDTAVEDQDGYLWFGGRTDDLITSAGYRIGPSEIEECLLRHPAVAMAAVIGVPDALRTERIKAFIVCRPGMVPDAALEESLRIHVRDRLAAHEYPREFAFVPELPLTSTGKIMRRVLRDRERSANASTTRPEELLQ
jgi:acetyl-CoA synthetase